MSPPTPTPTRGGSLQRTADELMAIGRVAKTCPEYLTMLERRYMVELERLPYVRECTAAAQGRCQVLSELCADLRKSLE